MSGKECINGTPPRIVRGGVLVQKGRNAPIAVLDSGVGGIAVLAEARRRLVHENFLYFGDGVMSPYGEKDPGAVCGIVTAHAKRLLCHCKALLIACNTATAVAADALRAAYPHTPIIGMEPALRPALAVAKHPRILVLATSTTLAEVRFSRMLARFGDRAQILPLAAPLLVRLVEEEAMESPRMTAYLSELLAPYTGKNTPDAVVLGCTHFPFARHDIDSFFQGRVPILDGAAGTVRQLARRLREAGLARSPDSRGYCMLTSGDPLVLPRYRRMLLRVNPTEAGAAEWAECRDPRARQA